MIIMIIVALFVFSDSGGGLPEEFPAPDFMLTDIFNGSQIQLSAFRGRPVILYFFASW
jgi:hypothetical protein